jgi:hypothetical protein
MCHNHIPGLWKKYAMEQATLEEVKNASSILVLFRLHYETQDRERFLVRGPVRQDFFSGPTAKSDWFLGTFSVNQGISCLGVNREKLPAKCLPFPVMVGWYLAGSFTQLPSKSSLSPMSVNFPCIAGIFSCFSGCRNWFKLLVNW